MLLTDGLRIPRRCCFSSEEVQHMLSELTPRYAGSEGVSLFYPSHLSFFLWLGFYRCLFMPLLCHRSDCQFSFTFVVRQIMVEQRGLAN
jgi:hypothetical protein